jgi:hypothetical protein
LNRAQKCQEFNGENRFSIGYFVEELSQKKIKEIGLDARISVCQLL